LFVSFEAAPDVLAELAGQGTDPPPSGDELPFELHATATQTMRLRPNRNASA
jgi:hypothetical protein